MEPSEDAQGDGAVAPIDHLAPGQIADGRRWPVEDQRQLGRYLPPISWAIAKKEVM
jgi:hypothetical protein